MRGEKMRKKDGGGGACVLRCGVGARPARPWCLVWSKKPDPTPRLCSSVGDQGPKTAAEKTKLKTRSNGNLGVAIGT
jgi:hypothetical protein